MAEFSAGLQTWQEKRYVILLFLLLLGGSFTILMTFGLAIPPLTVKNRGGGDELIRDRALNWANMVYHTGGSLWRGIE